MALRTGLLSGIIDIRAVIIYFRRTIEKRSQNMKTGLLLAFVLLMIAAVAVAGSPGQPQDALSSTQSDSLLSGGTTADSASSNFVYPMSSERKEKLIAYSRFNNIWRFAGFFISVGILLLALYTGLSARFRKWAEAITRREFLISFFYFLFLMLFLFLINLPFDYYRSFVIEHRYSFSNQTVGAWFGETLKSEAVGFVIGFIVVLILYWLIKRFKRWWLIFAVGSIPFMAFMILIAPVVISPMFNKFEPIKSKELAAEMTALAAKAGIHNPDIFEVDASKQSSKVNAYFTGLFGTKRIVLYDTAIKNFTVNELKFIMGHEIGHYIKNHIWYGLLMAVVLIFIGGYLIDKFLPRLINRQSRILGFTHLSNIAGLPLLILFVTVFGFVAQPIMNGASRYFEYQADEYGMQISGVTGDEAATAFDKLSVFNLSDPEPSALIEFWFYDHPALIKRMENVHKLYDRIHSGV